MGKATKELILQSVVHAISLAGSSWPIFCPLLLFCISAAVRGRWVRHDWCLTPGAPAARRRQ